MHKKEPDIQKSAVCSILIVAALLMLGMFVPSATVQAQSRITAITTSSSAANNSTSNVDSPSDVSNDIISNTNYNVLYGRGDSVVVSSYTVDGIVNPFNNFVFPDTLIIRRTDGSRFINIWYTLIDDPLNDPGTSGIPDGFNTAADPDELSVDASEVSDADAIYLTRNINAGYDNVLVNNDDQAPLSQIQAQVERVDVIWYTGIVTCEPANTVFPVIERGGNDQIKIAAITSLDSNGDPLTYSTLIDIEDSDWPGGTTQGVLYNNFLVLRRQTVGNDPIPLINFGADVSTNGEQLVQGVAVSFSEFGIIANQTVYGYSLFAFDVNASDHTLTDVSTFPTNTQASDSGLDLVAGVAAAVANDNCLTTSTGPGGYKQALATWLKANESADVTTSTEASTVTDWQDHWLGDHDATTGVAAPTYRSTSSTINFNPTVDFTTSATSLGIANNSDFNTDSNASTQYTNKGLNIAFRTATDVSTRQVLYEQGSGDRGIIVYLENNGGTQVFASSWNRTSDGTGAPWNNGTNINTISRTIAANTEYIVTLEQDGNSSITGSLTMYLNGASVGTLSNVGLLWDDTGDIELGASGGTTQYADGSSASTNSFDGEISEFIYCNEPANFALAQRNRIESYLAIKYGITLDQTSPYDYVDSDGNVIYDATNTLTIGGYLEYNHDIAGIGRDDGSELTQLKSKSENTGSIVTMEKTTTFGTDDTYLIWGNDDGATTTQSSDAPALINTRLTREWRVAEEKEAGPVSVTFDITGLGLGTTASDFSLLVAANDSDNSFTNAQIISGGTLVGNELTFTGVDFADGEYFTLGTSYITCHPGGVSTALSLWLRADLGPSNSTNGGLVSTWEDRAGSNNATVPGSGDEPAFNTNVINFNPALDFSGAQNDASNDTELQGSAGFYSTGYYVVFQPEQTNELRNTLATPPDAVVGFGANTAATQVDLGCLCIYGFNSDVSNELYTHAIGSRVGSGSPNGEWRRAITNASGTVPLNVPQIMAVRDNSGGTSTEIYQNGEESSNQTGFGTGNVFITSSNEDYMIGNFNAGTSSDRDFDGKIAEVISFSARPSDTDHAQVQSYLAIKYGINLSTDTNGNSVANENISGSLDEGDYVASNGSTFYWEYDATYSNDVAGIVRDDNSCLDQRQGKSESTDAIVTIGNNTIAATNQENTNALTTDRDHLMWGNDNAAREFASRTTGVTGIGSVTERMTRIWHVNEGGTTGVGNTTVSFDLAGLGYSSNASDFTFIQSASASLTSATTYTNGTFNGDVLTFTGINFNDEDYFTLGTAVSACGPGGVTTDLNLWLRADAGTNTSTDNTAVSSWTDQSSSSNNATNVDFPGSTIINPLYQDSEINFNPAIQIQDPGSNNASFIGTTSLPTTGADFTLIAIVETGQNAGTQGNFNESPAIIGGETTTGTGLLDFGLVMESGQVAFNASSGDAFDIETTGTFNDNFPHIFTATRVQTGGSLALFVDGNSEGTATAGSGLTLNEAGSIGIGNHDSEELASQFDGKIAEVIVFNDDLTAAEQTRVEAYLALKYGITRSNAAGGDAGDYANSSGTNVWDASVLSAYHHDVAGLVRDDGSCLTQTKSKSENSDAIVTMEITSLTDDDSYMIWGNDNANLEDRTNTEFPAGINSRLNREWRVEENGAGTVGTVTITFDLSSVSGPTGVGTNELSQIRLMTDGTDSDFTSGVTLTEPSATDAVANTVSFEVNFADGMFFTLGSVQRYALPITLIHFDALPMNENQVKVEWTTVQEIGNAFFSVERSTDGAEFTTIARIDGAGDSNEFLEYSYIDESPLVGQSYYRLKQTDFNGTFSYSELAPVYMNDWDSEQVSLYPNPVALGETIKIGYSITQDRPVQFSFVSLNGAILRSEDRILLASEQYVELSTAGLRKGMHIIRMLDETEQVVSMKVLIK